MEKVRAWAPFKKMGRLTFGSYYKFNFLNYCVGEMEIAVVRVIDTIKCANFIYSTHRVLWQL